LVAAQKWTFTASTIAASSTAMFRHGVQAMRGRGLAAAFVAGGGTAFLGSRQASAASDVDAAKKAIAEVIAEDDNMGPTLVRLAWHSAGTWDAASRTGGSNGATMRFAPEAEHRANAGLADARNALEPVKKQFPGMSYSDLWVLAGYIAIEEMGGPVIEFTAGRTDAASDSACPPDGRLPNAQHGNAPADSDETAVATAGHVRAVFNRMGFIDQEIVALLGAHAMGRCHTEASGYFGPWTRAPTTFSNEYFTLLLEEEWSLKKWNGPEQYETASGDIMMLPADLILVQDVDFLHWAETYAADYETFASDFAAAFKKLTEFGLVEAEDTCAKVQAPVAAATATVAVEEHEEEPEEPEEGDSQARTVKALLARGATTAPVDARFPNQNQNKYCYALYTKFQRCLQTNSDDTTECFTLKRWTHDVCPKEWIEQWDELMESNAFPSPKDTF
jgi:cytochrome c peroxidase